MLVVTTLNWWRVVLERKMLDIELVPNGEPSALRLYRFLSGPSS
jgi:hypothetical protein